MNWYRFSRTGVMYSTVITTDGIKLMSHIMKICDRGVKARLRREVTISER